MNSYIASSIIRQQRKTLGRVNEKYLKLAGDIAAKNPQCAAALKAAVQAVIDLDSTLIFEALAHAEDPHAWRKP